MQGGRVGEEAGQRDVQREGVEELSTTRGVQRNVES